MNIVYLGLGSNQGDRMNNLSKALSELNPHVTSNKSSSIYETEPVGYANQPWFLNLVFCGSTRLDPFKLLAIVKEIESDMGRKVSLANAPRPIDIDILFFGNTVINTESLIIPHPLIAERAFVLTPLVEIASTLVHPVLGKNMFELLNRLIDPHKVRKWSNVPDISSPTL